VSYHPQLASSRKTMLCQISNQVAISRYLSIPLIQYLDPDETYMLKINPNENEYEIIEIAQIIYNDGKMDIFKAVKIADEGVYTGRIMYDDEFISGGFIPKQNIKKIKGGTWRKIGYKKSK
jgi:hypothetical protein